MKLLDPNLNEVKLEDWKRINSRCTIVDKTPFQSAYYMEDEVRNPEFYTSEGRKRMEMRLKIAMENENPPETSRIYYGEDENIIFVISKLKLNLLLTNDLDIGYEGDYEKDLYFYSIFTRKVSFFKEKGLFLYLKGRRRA